MLSALTRLLPFQCAFCRSWPSWSRPAGVCGVCADCMHSFGGARPRCPRCALPTLVPGQHCGACLRHPPALAHCFAAVDYAYPWQTAVGQFKFQHQPAWARAMADICLQQADARALLRAADRIVPVPLARARLQERGYNQAWELAKALARRSGQRHKLDARLVLRQPGAAPQVGLGRAARLRNLRQAFVLAKDAPPLRGQGILLVDDVMTTGATLQALAMRLQAAGAGRVDGLVFARTEAPSWR